jgi:hypothetical protein
MSCNNCAIGADARIGREQPRNAVALGVGSYQLEL